jgi:hypothetical protein
MLVLLTIFSALAFADVYPKNPDPGPPPFARVLETVGLTSLEPAHSNLAVGEALSEGDRVTTMSGSKLRLRLASGLVVEAGAHTEITLKENIAGEPLLRVPHGELYVVTKDAPAFEVRTAQLRLHVRAREFYLGQSGEKSALLAVRQGKAHAKWPHGELDLEGKRETGAARIYPQQPGSKRAGSKELEAPEIALLKLHELLETR